MDWGSRKLGGLPESMESMPSTRLWENSELCILASLLLVVTVLRTPEKCGGQHQANIWERLIVVITVITYSHYSYYVPEINLETVSDLASSLTNHRGFCSSSDSWGWPAGPVTSSPKLFPQGWEVWFHHLPVFRACSPLSEEWRCPEKAEWTLFPAELWGSTALLLASVHWLWWVHKISLGSRKTKKGGPLVSFPESRPKNTSGHSSQAPVCPGLTLSLYLSNHHFLG